ncbi:hypothetical protein [Roseibium sp.]|uniref:hypothetical protein n=1 Tax=Roseibium sp. TaxID=1936156 RepID=UPI003D1435EC
MRAAGQTITRLSRQPATDGKTGLRPLASQCPDELAPHDLPPAGAGSGGSRSFASGPGSPKSLTDTAPTAQTSPQDALTDEQIRNALIKTLQSPEFQSAPQLRAFLEFVVSATLGNHREKIKGYTIAVEALGRPQDFNPVTDPIVRVEAARLRRRLAKYYESSGASDPVRIEIPKGSYAPVFRRARPATAAGSSAENGSLKKSGKVSEETAEARTAGASPAPLAELKMFRQRVMTHQIALPFALLLAAACFLAGFLAASL